MDNRQLAEIADGLMRDEEMDFLLTDKKFSASYRKGINTAIYSIPVVYTLARKAEVLEKAKRNREEWLKKHPVVLTLAQRERVNYTVRERRATWTAEQRKADSAKRLQRYKKRKG